MKKNCRITRQENSPHHPPPKRKSSLSNATNFSNQSESFIYWKSYERLNLAMWLVSHNQIGPFFAIWSLTLGWLKDNSGMNLGMSKPGTSRDDSRMTHWWERLALVSRMTKLWLGEDMEMTWGWLRKKITWSLEIRLRWKYSLDFFKKMYHCIFVSSIFLLINLNNLFAIVYLSLN